MIELSEDELALEADWRETLPEVLRPIAQRYGKDAFTISWNIGASQEALQKLAQAFGRNANVMHAVQMAASAANQLAFYALESRQMDMVELRKIQLDIERAMQLRAASMQAGPNLKLIIPS